MSNIHSPDTAFALASGLSLLIRLAARQGAAINALLAELERTDGAAPSSVGEDISPQSLLPDDNLLVLAAELEVVATRIRVRGNRMRQVRSSLSRDDQSNVSRETSPARAEGGKVKPSY